ncbi:MAG: sulfatase-like hydrolase/transferase [Bacteroidales bacterium]|nr:sulfatase-like hydrolase/transferase [Bacteroidales bacterium]
MKKYLESIKSFLPIAICFIVVMFCVKCFELFTSDSVSISHILEMIFSNLVASLVLSFFVLIVFNIISIYSKKVAIYTSSVLFAIIVISEIGLIFYHNSTGLMMGRELIERPFWETFVTIKSVLHFWMIAAAILFVIGFVLINVAVSQSSRLNAQSLNMIMLILMLVSIPLFIIIKPNQNENAVNKIWYCFHSCFLEKYDDVDFRAANKKIEKFKKLFPERGFVDNEYPLERVDTIANVLGKYFKNSESKPNIVFIVVESLGADIFGINEYGYTFTPFLDSLSKHSLLWSNCISTTSRSFGVVPAITGSVPHGPRGFQFGNMPDHNSLYSVLKDNNYETSAFYAGDFSFDKVYDYLIAQKIDFMSPFYEDSKKKENKKYDFTYWGYQDKVMFDKSAEIISRRDKEKSYFDLLITISQHDNRLKLNDKKKIDSYYKKVSDIISTLPETERVSKKEISGHLASMLYGDDAIRDFVKKYSELHQDGNYIFVITGDHSLNLNPENPLDAYHGL